MKLKLAIVGSVRLAGNEAARQLIEAVIAKYQPDVIVSGGAAGIDTMAYNAAVAHGLEPEIYPPTKRRWDGPGGFKERNVKIATACDRLVRIVSSKSTTYGSGWTRDYAAMLGKPTEEHVIPE